MTIGIGVIIGGLVCVFGMWAFLRGQSTMLVILSGGKPALFEPKAHGDEQGGLAAQLQSMFRDTQAKQGK